MSFHLAQLLDAETPGGADAAWDAFVAEHSRLILFVAGETFPRHDERMDAYTFVLERLREDDFRRLRVFKADGRSKLSTWLTVVVRRLCIDYHRHRYGRARSHDQSASLLARMRWRHRLVDLASTESDLSMQHLLTDQQRTADEEVRVNELTQAIRAAITSLSAEDRLLLSLRFHDGLSAREIAEHLRLPTPFHVFRRLNATFTTLRGHLASRGVENGTP